MTRRPVPGAPTGESSGAIGAGVMVIGHALDPARLDASTDVKTNG